MIEQYVLDNKVDFALVEGGVSHPELLAEAFYSDRLCFVASPCHPLSSASGAALEEIARHDLLLREPGSAGREIADSLFLAKGITVTPAWESVSTQALLRAAEKQLGVAILPRLLVQQELASGALVEIPVPDAELFPYLLPDPPPQQISATLRRRLPGAVPCAKRRLTAAIHLRSAFCPDAALSLFAILCPAPVFHCIFRRLPV